MVAACSTPRLQGSFEEEVAAWKSDGGGEYPVAYYHFNHDRHFDYRVIFCMLTDRGSGKYSVSADEIRLVFGRQKERDTPPDWDISDTTIILKFKMLNDSTLIIGDTKFRRYR